jgi:Cu+-exporting ATPase
LALTKQFPFLVAAQNGILIKGGGAALQSARGVKTIIFDKTGTLTMGHPTVTNMGVYPTQGAAVPGSTETEILHLIVAVESASNHPLAKAAVQFATERLATLSKQGDEQSSHLQIGGGLAVGDVLETPGMGLVADLIRNDVTREVVYQAFIGSRRWVLEVNACAVASNVTEIERSRQVSEWQNNGSTVIYVGLRQVESMSGTPSTTGTLLAMLAITDPPRPTTAFAINALQKMGIRVIMMTGDQRATAVAVARQIGLSESDVIAGCLPHEKGENVKKVMEGLFDSGVYGSRDGAILEQQPILRKKRGKVAFAGDGINDSVALATADVG